MDDKDKAILELYQCVDSFLGELTNLDPYYDHPTCHEEKEAAFKLMKKYEPLIAEINQAWPASDCKCHPHDVVYYGCRCK